LSKQKNPGIKKVTKQSKYQEVKNNMKKLVVGPEHLVIGIDIAKSLHWAQCIDPFGKKLGKPFSFQNTREGFENLVSKATACLKEQGLKKVVFGMEPTGHYGKALAEYLVELGYTYVLVNPMHVKKSKEKSWPV
jgi:transposase